MLRLSEHYVSVQGEGPRTGVMTQFVRFAGCNMRCPGWPCDTPYAIYPDQYRNDSKKAPASTLAESIFDQAEEFGAHNICLTGGEPLLQPQEALRALMGSLRYDGNHQLTFEIFTNGSFEFPKWVSEYDVRVMMDWKLQGSGEAKTERSQRKLNALKLTEQDGIKFVVKDEEDLMEAVALTVLLENDGYKGVFWVGRVWGTELADEAIVDFIKQMGMPWRLNVQVHKYIWPEALKGV